MNKNDELNLFTFISARRVGNSRNGNPTWRVTFENVAGSFLTQTDSSTGYDIPNWKTGDKVAVKLTPKTERIIYAYRVRIINGRAVRID